MNSRIVGRAGLAGLAVVISLVAGGVAAATIPSTSDGAITACVDAEGAPRIIDVEAEQACAEGETQISWGPGWKPRGMYLGTETYAPGDVVQAMGPHEACSRETGGIYLKAAAGAEKRVLGITTHPCRDATWVKVYAFPAPPPVVSARLGASDSGHSRTPNWRSRYHVASWSYSDGTTWLLVNDNYGQPLDVRQCVVNAMPVTTELGATVTRTDTDYKEWILLYKSVGTRRVSFPIDVTLSCP